MNKTLATRIVTCLVVLAGLSLILGSSCKTASLDNSNPSQGTGQSSSAVVLSNALLVLSFKHELREAAHCCLPGPIGNLLPKWESVDYNLHSISSQFQPGANSDQ
jgi:hypothetical protein